MNTGGVSGMIASRLMQILVVLLLASFVIFMLLQLVPGDPAVALAGDNATEGRLQEIRSYYGFDRALRDDRGTARAACRILSGRACGRHHQDCLVAGRRNADFWLAMVLVSTFALSWRWFPATGLSAPFSDPLKLLQQLTLPSIALAATGIAIVARQMRAALIEVLSSQYVRTLYAKGLPVSQIVWKHGMRNVAVKMLTIVGLTFNHPLGASVVVETAFAVPGMGTLVINGVLNKDFPVVQGVIIAMVVAVILVNCIVDILCALIDPRLSIKA
jgi:peptide/nickel transport system permease protein